MLSCTNQKSTFEYFPDGSVKSEYYIINGKKEGKYIEYYPKGKKRYVKYYKNGLLDGKVIEYYENGNPKRRGQFIDDKAYGFFRYYNRDNKLDSLKEFVLLNPDSIVDSYFFDKTNSNKSKESCLNRYIIYDNNKKPIMKKSVYFIIKFKNDTINKGDSLKAVLFFNNPTYNKKNKFEVNVLYKDSFVKITPISGNYIVQYNTKTEKNGVNYFQGFIEENVENKRIKYLFFKYEYYVR
jgi:hypothetical protein